MTNLSEDFHRFSRIYIFDRKTRAIFHGSITRLERFVFHVYIIDWKEQCFARAREREREEQRKTIGRKFNGK